MKTTITALCATLSILFTACDEPAAPTNAEPVLAREAGIDPCERLTPAALQAVIDELEDAVALAEANAEVIVSDAYPAATQLAIDELRQARDYMIAHRTWLNDTHIDMASAIAAYNLHCSGREAAYQAAHGHYWAAISAIYNHTEEGELAAERGIAAQLAVSQLAADGLQCYMRAYLGE